MADEPTSAELLERYQRGDEDAASLLFERYLARLTTLARTRLSPRLARRLDPEDVVLSTYRSFFLGARAGRFELRRSGDLWRLLVSIALHKLYRQAKHHRAAKRSFDREQQGRSPDAWLPAREPTADEALALADELSLLLEELAPPDRRILELRLQDESVPAIAAETGRAERTVRRVLERFRDRLKSRSEGGDEP